MFYSSSPPPHFSFLSIYLSKPRRLVRGTPHLQTHAKMIEQISLHVLNFLVIRRYLTLPSPAPTEFYPWQIHPNPTKAVKHDATRPNPIIPFHSPLWGHISTLTLLFFPTRNAPFYLDTNTHHTRPFGSPRLLPSHARNKTRK